MIFTKKPSEPRDITMPDGTIRHNVGSDNLSDEDRAAMREAIDGWVKAGLMTEAVKPDEEIFSPAHERQIEKFHEKLKAEILSLHRQLAEAKLDAYNAWNRYEMARNMYVSLMEERAK